MQKKYYYGAPTKGRNDRNSPIMLDRDEAAELTNFVPNDRGILDKVEGYLRDGAPFPDDADSFIRMMINYRKGTTGDFLVMAALDDGNTNSTYKVDYKTTSGDGSYSYLGHTAGTSASFTNGNTAVTGTGTSWSSHLKAGDKIKATAHADAAYAEIQSVNSDTSITLTANYSGDTAAGVAYTARIITDKGYIPRATVFNNKCVITNGIDKMMTWDNTTLNCITDTDHPRAKFIETHKSRVFAASTTGSPSSIYWSAVNDESSWDATSFEPVFPQDNGNIIAIKSYADSLIVLKNNGNIYQVVGDFDTSAAGEVQFIRKIDTTENIGNIAERSVVVHTDGLYFLSNTGVWRLDPRLYLEKMSYSMDEFLSGVSYSLGPSQSKSHVYDTQTQWNTGTYSGLYADAGGTLRNFNDKLAISDVETYIYASTIDVNNVVHVVYTTTGSTGAGRKIKYANWAVDGTVTYQDVMTEAAASPRALCIASNSAGTELSLAWSVGANIKYMKRASGTWQSGSGSAGVADTLLSGSAPESLDFGYQGSDIYGVVKDGGNMYYMKRVSGSWTFPTITSATASGCIGLAFNYNSGNPRILLNATGSMDCYYTNNGGSSWSTFAGAVAGVESCAGLVMNGGKAYSVYINSATPTVVRQKNWDDNTSTTISTESTASRALGHRRTGSKDYYFIVNNISSDAAEKFFFDASSISTASDATPLVYPYSLSVPPVNQAHFDHSGAVFVSSFRGANTNELIVRRMSFIGTWTSPVVSDATQTAWGNYDVGNPISGGNTVAYTIATATTSSLPAESTITNGSLIHSDGTRVYAQTTISITLTAFSQLSSIESLTLNYTGPGVDAKQAVALSFDTELYIALSELGDSANSYIMFRDSSGAWTLLTHPVSAMCVYKGVIYAGKSTNGDLIKLRNTYGFNGTAYTATYISKEDFLDSIDLEKDIFKIYVLYEVKSAGSFTFSYRLDNFVSVAGASWTSATVDQTTKGIAEILVGQKARTIQCRVQNSSLDNECSIIGFVIVLGPGGNNGYLHQR